ncbi:MAG: hypothetical protein HC814_05615 [Rhodobacteraceae bacterium]|nr:hypothetical protein [Paracoccaceae bacterium]
MMPIAINTSVIEKAASERPARHLAACGQRRQRRKIEPLQRRIAYRCA